MCLFTYYFHSGQDRQYCDVRLCRLYLHQRAITDSDRQSRKTIYKQKLVQSLASGFFYFSGPAVWNSPPCDLCNVTDTGTFKRRMKTVLFGRVSCS